MGKNTDGAAEGAGRKRDAPIGMDGEAFRAAGHALVDTVADFLESLPERPVTRNESPEALRDLIGGDATVPEEGADARILIERGASFLFDHSLFNGHPRFMGYVTSSPAPIGMLGDFLAAAANPNVGAWRIGPAATEIELQTVRWIADLVGYPRECGGLLVSGGNVANLVGVLAARVWALGSEVRQNGVGGARCRIYASAETHTWIQKAADISGLGTDAIRWIEVDDRLRMKVDALSSAIKADRAEGDLPVMVAGTAGTVSTGAVDPLSDIAALCRDLGIWFHVDGAYGGFAAVLPDAPADVRALALADSVALDPHKWLYAPLEAGCVLVRDPQRLRDAFSYHPPYYHFGEEAVNLVDFGLQNSRGFRALKVWLALQQVGRRGYAKMIGDDMRLARELYGLAERNQELEPFTQDLSITTFRYVPRDLAGERGGDSGEAYLKRLNQELLERLQRSGEAFVSHAVIGGRYVLRACIVNFHTDSADLEALVDIVVRHGRAVDAALRQV